jgi:hypothetical protein
MAYTQTINTDQIFVRELFFKDFGNRPISSGQVLVTRGDGGIYFSNVSTSGLYSFSGVQAGDLSTVNATTMSTTLFLGAGPGISYTVSPNSGNSQRIFVNNLGIQQLGVYNDNSIINFSSLTVPTPAGRTLYMKGEGEIYIKTSTNTVIIGGAFSSSYSSILYLISTVDNLEDQVSTSVVYASTLLGEIIEYASTTNLSTLINDFYSLSTFVYTTFVDDGTGHHNTLIVSSIVSPNISTTNMTTSNLYVGNTHLYDSTLYTSTNYCTTYVADGPLNAVTNSFFVTDSITNVNAIINKTAYTNQSTSYGSTFYTTAQQIDFGLAQKYSNAPNMNPITQQIEAINYMTDPNGDTTVLKYELKNTVVADEICAQSTLRISAQNAINLSSQSVNANVLNTSTFYADNAVWRRAAGNELTLSTLCVSTIVGAAAPILTFDKTNYRVGVNLGPLMPLATLDVSGVVIANNFVTTSDRRLKQDITVLPLQPYISSYKYVMEGVADIGVIADEVEAIAPCCVYTRPDGYKAVSYPKLVPILLSYIHDLNARLTAIERNI